MKSIKLINVYTYILKEGGGFEVVENFLNRHKGNDDQTLLDNCNIKKSERSLESIPPPKTLQNHPTIN